MTELTRLEPVDERLGREIPKRAVRAARVVVDSPSLDRTSGVGEIDEPSLTETLVAEFAVEGFRLHVGRSQNEMGVARFDIRALRPIRQWSILHGVKGPDFDGFTWEADKSERCYQERGFDFDEAAKAFEGDSIEWEDRRRDYGEQRFVTVGQVADKVLAVVWTPRNNVRRIISARPASRSEREKLYANREAYQQRDS